jgi:hypothetical protein
MTLNTYTYFTMAIIDQLINYQKKSNHPQFQYGNVNSLGMTFKKVTHLLLR